MQGKKERNWGQALYPKPKMFLLIWSNQDKLLHLQVDKHSKSDNKADKKCDESYFEMLIMLEMNCIYCIAELNTKICFGG